LASPILSCFYFSFPFCSSVFTFLFSLLKGPKHEIFDHGVLTQIRSVLVGDLT
jgi:hypothetical protein